MEHVDTARQSKCDEMNLLVRPLALISLLILQALPHVSIDYCWLGYLPWVSNLGTHECFMSLKR